MTLLTPLPVKADRFTWMPGERMFVAEISDIGGYFERVWDDSIDVGLTLQSRYPGREDIVFVIEHQECDREGDILYWDLKPALLSVRKKVNFTVRVYND